MKKQSFETFYLNKVALGDCCGCAERVIDWCDIELARKNLHRSQTSGPTSLRLPRRIRALLPAWLKRT